MTRLTAIKITDAISFVGFVMLSSTGVLLHYLLPPGSGQRITIWGLSRHDWGNIHFYIALIFFSVLIFHLFLHWRIILNMVKGSQSEGSWFRLGLGLTGLVAVLLLASAPLVSPVNIEIQTGNSGQHQMKNKSK